MDGMSLFHRLLGLIYRRHDRTGFGQVSGFHGSCKRARVAIALARQVCKSQGWEYVASEFWDAYFAECAKDEWLRGDKPNPNNPKWRQNIDVLLAEDRFAEIMDRAIASMRGEP